MSKSISGPTMHPDNDRDRYDLFEGLYRSYNRREYISSDPVQFLHRYDNPRDREVAGLIASSLAYGRVAQILRSVTRVLDAMGNHPARFLMRSTDNGLSTAFYGFVHRFTTGDELVMTLGSIRDLMLSYGSIEAAFADGCSPDDRDVFGALDRFSEQINRCFRGTANSLIPRHDGKSAMKRLNLFLRWMVRSDEVDPGGWTCIRPAHLGVPLDTHLFRIAAACGFTTRRSADRKAAVEITGRFAAISPDDPVRYDFALTRLGILPGLSIDDISPRATAVLEGGAS